jgi:exonuclease SbcD
MKKPVAIIFNDVHLKTGNEKDVEEAFDYMIQYAKENKITNLIFAGDLFDSRSFQRQEVLQTLDRMLIKIHEAKLWLDWFPGNHDKTIYASYDSFLDVYKHYPNTRFHREISDIEIGSLKITLLPFFSDDMLIPMIKDHQGSDVLISHFEMAGSTHLGKVSEKTSINKRLLSKWNKVYLGHYHNHHEITKDIVHLPSFIQASFGEDNKKGFSILYDDLSYEIIKGRFREYTKLRLKVDDLDSKAVERLVQDYGESQDTIRIEIYGEESKLKAFDKSRFNGSGIDVKLKYESKYEFDESDLVMPEVIEKYDKGQVFESFEQFCKDKRYNHEVGVEYLKEYFKTR